MRTTLAVAAAFVLAAAGSAQAAGLKQRAAADTTLAGVSGTTTKACQAGFRPGAAGVVTRTVKVPAGVSDVTARLGGGSGDWDLAVFDATGRAIAAGASPDASEVAEGWTSVGGALRVQACRRSGSDDAVALEVDYAQIPGKLAGADVYAPKLVDVLTPTRADKDRLTALGVDLTGHGGTDSVGVVLNALEDENLLLRNGFRWRVKVADMLQQDRANRLAEERSAARRRGAGARALPSGRADTYRTLADYESELKALAEQNPGIVRLVTLPNKTGLGRDVLGVEISTNVDAADGKPTFFNMGIHHAREWPAGELTMEWAYELVNGYKAGDARAKKIVENSRNLVVPVVNPDGFNASRSAGAIIADGGRDETVDDTIYLVAGAVTGGEYRRKNCRVLDTDTSNCTTSVGLAENGTDPNRNYGTFWGGPGSDTNPLTQTYRGPAPFSEPETQNIKAAVSGRQVTSLITNHTTAGLVLRAPGLAALGDPLDENRGYKQLGDDMAKETGYFSQKSFELYDTTGTTEDWAYNATGAFGFTFEAYCGAPNYETGDCDAPAFHPRYARVVEEWDGTSAQADHVNDPAGPYDGKGNREAFYIAAESAINETRHAVLDGTAPAGAKLRISKAFKSATSPQPQADGSSAPILFDDKLESTVDVGADGRYRWHMNPSTRPIVGKAIGDPEGGTASPPITGTGGTAGSSTTEDDPDDGAAVPNPTENAPPTTSYNDHPFTIPATGKNTAATVRIQWTTPLSDWDIELYEDTDGDGKSGAGDKLVTTSGGAATDSEQVSIPGGDALAAGKKYVLRVINYTTIPQIDDYDFSVTFEGPQPYQAPQVEKWTLTCEVGGKVVKTSQLTIDRNQIVDIKGDACTGTTTDLNGPGYTPGVGAGDTPAGCVVSDGFKSVGVAPRGRGAKLNFTRERGVTSPVAVTVFAHSRGRKVLKKPAVARFPGRQKAVSWNGKANVTGRSATANGYYVVSYKTKTSTGNDIRRVVLKRTKGRFKVVKAFDRRASCGLLRTFKLGKATFGGRTNAPLKIVYRLAEDAKVTISVLKGGKTVRTFKAADAKAGKLGSATFGAKKARGDYKVRIKAVGRTQTVTATLTSRRL